MKLIYDSLPKKQKKFVAPSGGFVDSPNSVVRVIFTHDEGFAEIYEFEKGVGFLTMAIKPQFQGLGFGKKLLKRALEIAKEKGLKEVIYEGDKNNAPSLKFAEKHFGKADEINDESVIWRIEI